MKIKRAIISVSDKQNLVAFAQGLVSHGIEIISTGGTYTCLKQNGIPCKEVQNITNFPECLDGRVKTLHPHIFAGILARRDLASHTDRIQDLGIDSIDLVVVNLYPFRSTILNPSCDFEAAIENIDIGGPSLLRAAAKNHQSVTVITDPRDYTPVLRQIETTGNTSYQTRFQLAKKVFEHTAAYDALISQYFLSQSGEKELPDQLTLSFEKNSKMRYGENPQQEAYFYQNAWPFKGSLCQGVSHQGKELSFNNIADTDAAIACLREFTKPTVVAVKHANPCGVGSGDSLAQAWDKAYLADPVSIFGGIIATNQTVDEETANKMKEIFLEVIVAPSFTPEALKVFESKKNLRIVSIANLMIPLSHREINFKSVYGGMLVQDPDQELYSASDFKVVTTTQLDQTAKEDLDFAMKIVKHVKSNAIVIVKDEMTIGIGPGQTNRVGAAKIALEMAGEKASQAILASDAFFPFSDCVILAAEYHIKAIIQPGGSLRDQDSIDACNQHNIAMVFTGMRHFKH